MSVTVTLDINMADFERQAMIEIRRVVQEEIKGVLKGIEQSVRVVVEDIIRKSDEALSLLDGDLRKLFGLENPSKTINSIIVALCASISVEFIPPLGQDGVGGVVVHIMREDLQDVLNADGATYISHSNQRNTDIEVPWLDWLLKGGDQIQVAGFQLLADERVRKREFSRTESWIMIQPKSPKGYFTVPSNFSGAIGDNWLTRCMSQAQGPVADIVVKALERLFSGGSSRASGIGLL